VLFYFLLFPTRVPGCHARGGRRLDHYVFFFVLFFFLRGGGPWRGSGGAGYILGLPYLSFVGGLGTGTLGSTGFEYSYRGLWVSLAKSF